MQTGKAISVPAILKVGNGTLNQLGSYLKGEGLKQVVIFLGNGLIDMFGETVMESLKKEEITVLEYSELDTVDIDDIITLAFSMPNKTQAVISIGIKVVPNSRENRCRKICRIFKKYSIYQRTDLQLQ